MCYVPGAIIVKENTGIPSYLGAESVMWGAENESMKQIFRVGGDKCLVETNRVQ